MANGTPSDEVEANRAIQHERMLYEELSRLELGARARLAAIQTRAAQLTASAGLVAAIVGMTRLNGLAVGAGALFAVSAGLGAAAQWPQSGPATIARKVLDSGRGVSTDMLLAGLNNGILATTETIDRISDGRSLLTRVGLVIQLSALVALVTSIAIEM